MQTVAFWDSLLSSSIRLYLGKGQILRSDNWNSLIDQPQILSVALSQCRENIKL